MSDEIQGLILDQLKDTRKEIGSLHEKINSNHTKIIERINKNQIAMNDKVYKVDTDVLKNKLKLTIAMSLISICWGIILNVFYRKYL